MRAAQFFDGDHFWMVRRKAEEVTEFNRDFRLYLVCCGDSQDGSKSATFFSASVIDAGDEKVGKLVQTPL